MRRLLAQGAYRPAVEEAAAAWLLDELTVSAAWDTWRQRQRALAAWPGPPGQREPSND